MSAPFVDTTTWIPLAVLAASLVGSAHCVAMCGGLIAASCKSRSSWIGYQLGRLAGYLALGALAGWVGNQVFWLTYVSWIAGLLIGLSFLYSGLRLWQGQTIHLSIVPAKTLSSLYKKAGNLSWALGLLTALLPCGWLHSFVLGAVATRSPSLGATFLFAFWLGTLPALGFAPWLFDYLSRPLSRRLPKIAALILISAGLMSVGVKVLPSFFSPSPVHEHSNCH